MRCKKVKFNYYYYHSVVFSEQFDQDKNRTPAATRLNKAWIICPASKLSCLGRGGGARAANSRANLQNRLISGKAQYTRDMSSPLIVLQPIAYPSEKQEREATSHSLNPKITNTSDWIEIYPMNFFSQLQFVVEVKKRK